MKKYINSIRSNDSPILLDQFLIRNLPVSSVFFFWQMIFFYGQGFIHHFTHWLSLTMAEEHSSPVCQISDFSPPRLKMVLFLCIFFVPSPSVSVGPVFACDFTYSQVQVTLSVSSQHMGYNALITLHFCN